VEITMKGTTAMATRASTTEAPAVETPEVEQAEAPVKEQSVNQKRRAAYSAAETRLRENHAEEFRTLVTEEATARGVEYVFRLTEEEKAAKQLADLLAKYPGLGQNLPPQPLPAG
jgi:hypothetical protein